MIEILVIADDETGMLDTGARFAQKGIRTEAFIQKPTVEDLKRSEAVAAVVDTKTRHVSREEAYQRVYEISRTAVEAGVRILYKKTDSALRGHIGAELTALMDAADDRLDFFPAYPEAGRTTRKGIQYVDGIPVSESVFGKDELNPMTESYIPEILRKTSDAPVELVEHIEEWKPEKTAGRITVFDTENAEDFHRIMECFLKKKTPRLIAGCAGLAGELAERLELPGGSKTTFPAVNKIFALCGSSNPITRAQMDYAEEHGFVRFTLTKEDMTGEKQISRIRAACKEGKSIILDMEYLPPETAEHLGITKEQLGSLIVESVNEALLKCMDVLDGYVLFLTGGDTLGRFVQVSGCERIRILGEFSPGIAMNLFYIEGKEVYTISKSGGFGNKEILIHLKEKGGEIYER